MTSPVFFFFLPNPFGTQESPTSQSLSICISLSVSLFGQGSQIYFIGLLQVKTRRRVSGHEFVATPLNIFTVQKQFGTEFSIAKALSLSLPPSSPFHFSFGLLCLWVVEKLERLNTKGSLRDKNTPVMLPSWFSRSYSAERVVYVFSVAPRFSPFPFYPCSLFLLIYSCDAA